MASNDNMIVEVEVHDEEERSDQSIATNNLPAGQSTNNAVLDEIRRMGDTFSSKLKSVSDRVDRIAETVFKSPEPKRKRTAEPATSSKPWHERRDSGVRAPLPTFHDSDEESTEGDSRDTGERTELSESSKALITGSFASSLSNSERRKIRAQFPHSGLPQTRCPKLDAVFKSAPVKAETKTADAELGKIQAFVLDPVGPLLHLLERFQEEDEEMTTEDAVASLHDALRLVGNASCQISTIRRKRVLKALNPKIQDLAAEEEHFKEAAAQLFGNGFEKVMKDRAESIKILQKASKTSLPQQQKKFFPKGRSTAPQRGSGQNHGSRKDNRQWQQRRPTASSTTK